MVLKKILTSRGAVPKKYAPSNQYGGTQEIDVVDYFITLEMAKQICMLQRSEKGKQYREYFLKLEKAWNSPEAIMARALQFANKTLEETRQRAEIAENALDRIANGKGRFSMSQTAKALKLKGRNWLFAELRKMGLLKNNNEPYQNQIDEGHFITIVKTVDNGENKLVTLTTSKGLVYLAKKFNAQIDQSVQADY